MKIIVLVVLSSVGLHGQWITGFWYSGPEPVSAIPWSKYTHVIHSTSQANSNGTIDWSAISPADTTAIVAGGHAAGRKVLWTLGDRGGAMASATSSGTIAAFVNNIVNFTNSHGYDGVDLDWESRVNVPQFENLITLLRQAMPAKIITMDALEGDPATVAAATQSSLDQVNVMCYDMWGGLGPSLSFHNDAIYGNTPFGNAGGCAWRMNRVMIHGIDAAKLGVGIPFYGYRFKGVTGPLQIGQS